MTFASYTWAGPAGKDRGGTRERSGDTKWIVLHTSEGGESPTSAENLAAFVRSPATPGNVASYHQITDTDRVLVIMDDRMRPNAGAGANDGGLHICLPGRASQSRSDWLDPVSAAYIEQAARATADWCQKWNIPDTLVFANGMKQGAKGITDHNQVRLAFGQTTHTDVGPNFPWDVFANRVTRLLTPIPPPPTPPPEDDDMALTFVAVRPDGGTALVSHDGAGCTTTWLDDREPFLAQGVKLIKVTADEFDRFFTTVPPIKVVNGTTEDPFDVKLV